MQAIGASARGLSLPSTGAGLGAFELRTGFLATLLGTGERVTAATATRKPLRIIATHSAGHPTAVMIATNDGGIPVDVTPGEYHAQPRKALRPVRGLLRGLGPAPSAETIDEARRELWASFVGEDPR